MLGQTRTLASHYSNLRTNTMAAGKVPASPAPGDTSVAGGSPTSSVACTQAGTMMSINPLVTPAKSDASHWKIGQIIKVPHIVISADINEKDPDLRVWTNRVGYICPKIRYAVVIAVYATRMIALPIYSSYSKGVTNKDDDYKLTAMSIYNPIQRNDAQVTSLLTPERLTVKGLKLMNPGSHVNLTEPLTIHYRSYLSPCDFLTETSTTLIRRRYKQALEMSGKSLSDHAAWFRRQIQKEQDPATTVQAAMNGPSLAGSTTAGTNFSYATMASRGNV